MHRRNAVIAYRSSDRAARLGPVGFGGPVRAEIFTCQRTGESLAQNRQNVDMPTAASRMVIP